MVLVYSNGTARGGTARGSAQALAEALAEAVLAAGDRLHSPVSR